MIPNFGIPVPSVEIQKKIVSECSKTEELYQKCIYGISRLKGEIDSVLADSHSKATTDIRLDNEQVFNLSIGRRVLKSELKRMVHMKYSVPMCLSLSAEQTLLC